MELTDDVVTNKGISPPHPAPWHTQMFLWAQWVRVTLVPISICMTKLAGMAGILCIPLQRHIAGDANKSCLSSVNSHRG